MESIEKLRELAADINDTEIIDHLDVVGKFIFHSEWLDSWHKAFDAACDGIEREIAETHVELPQDADGVPLRLGDEVSDGKDVFVVNHVGLYLSSGVWSVYDYRHKSHEPSSLHHVKNDPLMMTLLDFYGEYNAVVCDSYASDGESFKVLMHYADELRKMGGDA